MTCDHALISLLRRRCVVQIWQMAENIYEDDFVAAAQMAA